MKNRIFGLITAVSIILLPSVASAHTRHVDTSDYNSRHGIRTQVRYNSFTNKYMANDPRYIYEYNQIHAASVNAPAPCNTYARPQVTEYIRAINLSWARVSPNAGSATVRMVAHGDSFQVMGQNGSWYAVNVPNHDGVVWVPKSDFIKTL